MLTKCPKCGEHIIRIPHPHRMRGYTFGCLSCGWVKKRGRSTQ